MCETLNKVVCKTMMEIFPKKYNIYENIRPILIHYKPIIYFNKWLLVVLYDNKTILLGFVFIEIACAL